MSTEPEPVQGAAASEALTPAAVSEPFTLLRSGTRQKGDRTIEITEADLDQAVRNFEADREAGVEIPTDYDHSFSRGAGSKASGWIRRLARRGHDLICEVEWTDAARNAIAAREFRFISAEFSKDHRHEGGEGRGFAILSAGLTNRPFIRDLTVALDADSFHNPGERAGAPLSAEALLEEAEKRLDSDEPLDFEAERLNLRAIARMDEDGVTYEAAIAATRKENR